MAKAWRNAAARKINERRDNGSKEPSARQQLAIRKALPTIKPGLNWLLAGLFINAGITPRVVDGAQV